MGIISDSPTIKQEDKRKSAPQKTAVGSGSRPTGSKFKLPTSAPTDPHGLGREPPGALK